MRSSFLKLIRGTIVLFLGALTVVALLPTTTSGTGKSLLLAAISFANSGSRPIPEGKYLYKFDWNGIPSAESEVAISIEERDDGPLYRFDGTARTSKFVDVFWKLRAHVVAIVDVLTGRALKISVDNEQNQKLKKTETVFNYGSAEAYYKRWKKENVHEKKISLTGNAVDPASLGLIICQQPLKVKDLCSYTVLFEDDTYALEYTVAAREKITVAGEEFDAFRVEPKFCKISDKKNNKPPKVKSMTLWLSDTEPRIPLKMKSKTFIGYVNGELAAVTPNDGKGQRSPSNTPRTGQGVDNSYR